ncbi:MAG: PQQ-binding-like beta-propeller repeat protein [Planctomyces sp.]|nr:PQQ-binding-like beta-propeller repeat protein [Planctomyces sp.]
MRSRRAAHSVWSSAGQRFAIAATVLLLACAGRATAQVRLDGADADLDSFLRQRVEVRNARLESVLKRARSVLESNPDQAIDLIQSILAAPEDAPVAYPEFTADAVWNGPSIKDAAEDLLRLTTPEIQDLYERRFGGAAQSLVEAALRRGESQGLHEAAREYAMTAAGRNAMWRLAMLAFDRGEPATVGRWCDRVGRHPGRVALEPQLTLVAAWAARESGADDDAARMLASLRERFPDGLPLGARRLAWPAGGELEGAWLDGILPPRMPREPAAGLPAWTVAHGDFRRNAPSPAAPPLLDSAWTSPVIDRYDSRKPEHVLLIEQQANQLNERQNAASPSLPVATPLVVDDRVIYAGYGSVKAARLSTGELLWSTMPIDDTLTSVLADDDPGTAERRPAISRLFLGQRAFRDHVDGSISTDGKRVYRISHGGLVGQVQLQQTFAGNLAIGRSFGPMLPRNYNYLHAYTLSGGRLCWDSRGNPKGGPPRQANADLLTLEEDLPGTYFCSAPLPWNGELLCVVEQSGQLRLISLDAERGTPLWSQGLSNSERDLTSDPDRRFAGVSPALDGSTLVASVGSGTLMRIVAFDVSQRRWLWSYTFATRVSSEQQRLNVLAMRRVVRPGETTLEAMLNVDDWADSRAVIAGGRVLATPVGQSQLMCLDLATGERLWRRDRNWALYLAGVHDSTVVLVGRSEVRGLSLADGSTLWTTPIPPPSGRGVRVGDRYTLPLTSAEMLTLDLRDGQVLARTSLPSGVAAGNLVSAPGRLLTQTANEVRAFQSLSDIETTIGERLASNERDAEGLRLRGELRLHNGAIEQGEADLTIAAEGADPRQRRSLAWSLVSGLRRDFDRYFPRMAELESLSADPGLLSQAWLAVADGLVERGDPGGALLAVIRSAEEIDGDSDRLIDRDGSLRVRERGLLKGRALDLWAALPEEQRPALIAAVRDHLELLPPQSGVIERALSVLPRETVPEQFELARIEQNLLPVHEAESRLLSFLGSSDPEIATRAALQLARSGFADSKGVVPPRLAARLQGPLADVPIGEGRTALDAWREIVAGADPAHLQLRRPLASDDLSVSVLSNVGGVPENQTSVRIAGRPSRLLEGWVFILDQATASLSAYDATGAFRWRESTGFRGAHNAVRISAAGRLLLLELGDGFRVIDALTAQTLQTVGTYDSSDQMMIRIQARALAATAVTRLVGPITSRFIAYVESPRARVESDVPPRLTLIDPYTRRELWSRAISSIGEVLTSDDAVVVVSPLGDHLAFRTADGRPYPATRVPDGWAVDRNYRIGVLRFLFRPTADGIEYGMLDPVSGEILWTRTAGAAARYAFSGGEIAVVDPQGRFELVDGDTGELLVASRLEPQTDLDRISVVQDSERVYVSRNRSVSVPTSIPLNLEGVDGGLAAIDRQTGETLWQRTMDRLSYDPQQPRSWPFLILSGTDVHIRGPARQTTVQLIDRATGRDVFRESFPATTDARRSWKQDPSDGAMTLRIGDVAILITPRSPEGADPPAGEPSLPEQPPEPGDPQPPAPPIAVPPPES